MSINIAFSNMSEAATMLAMLSQSGVSIGFSVGSSAPTVTHAPSFQPQRTGKEWAAITAKRKATMMARYGTTSSIIHQKPLTKKQEAERSAKISAALKVSWAKRKADAEHVKGKIPMAKRDTVVNKMKYAVSGV